MGQNISNELNRRGFNTYGSVNPSAKAEHWAAKVSETSRWKTPNHVVLMGGAPTMWPMESDHERSSKNAQYGEQDQADLPNFWS